MDRTHPLEDLVAKSREEAEQARRRRRRLWETAAFDYALRGATILAVLALGAAGLLLPHSVLRGGAAWLAFLFFVLSGWGYLIVRIRRVADPDFGLRAAWGAAGYIAVCGVLVAAGVCTRPVILMMIGLGAVGFAWRELVAPAAGWHVARDALRYVRAEPGVGVIAILLVLFALFQMLGAVATLDRNPWDDDLAYTPMIRRLLDAGDLAEPFSFRRMSAYGGQTVLGALAAARGTLANVHLVDKGLFFGLTLLILLGKARERRCPPVWIALILLVLLLLPDTSINTATHWTGVAMFFALYRAVARDHWSLVGLVGAATCTLRQNYIAVVVLFVGLVLLRRLRATGRLMTWRQAWQIERPRWKRIAAVALLAIVPWWVAAMLSNGTFLFPFVGGTWNADLSLTPEVLTWADELLYLAWASIETTPIYVVPVLFVLLALTEDDRVGRPLPSFFAAVALGFVLLVHSFAGTDPAHLWRYAFGFGVALLAVLVVEIGAEHERAAKVPPLGRWLLLGALGLQILLSRGPAGKRVADLAGELRAAAAIDRRGDPSAAVERRRHAAMQAAIPEGARVAVMLDDPAFLDFARNRIANLDTPGYASVRAEVGGQTQQWPAFRGPEPLRAYLVAAGYRYLAFVRSERSRYFFRRGFWVWRIFNDSDFFQIMSAYTIDAIESFTELATTTRVLHDRDGLVVLDLEAPLKPARTREAPADERLRRGAWIRELAEREGLRDAWSLTSRTDLRLEDGFGDLVFVEGGIDDPRWFEASAVKILSPATGTAAGTAAGTAPAAAPKDEAAALRGKAVRPLQRRAHLRVRGDRAMRLALRIGVALNTVHTRPRIDLSLDGELLASAVPDERGRYLIDLVVPAERLTGDWQDVYLVFSSIAEPEKDARDLRVARVESVEWEPAR